MSRSFRRSYITDGFKGSKRRQFYKKLANHIVRKSQDIQNGKAYKKFGDSYNICDYRWYFNPNEEYYKEKFWQYLRK